MVIEFPRASVCFRSLCATVRPHASSKHPRQMRYGMATNWPLTLHSLLIFIFNSFCEIAKMGQSATANVLLQARFSYRGALLTLIAAILVPLGSADAQNSGPVVWVDKRVSLQGRRISSVQPVVNESKFEIPELTL